MLVESWSIRAYSRYLDLDVLQKIYELLAFMEREIISDNYHY